MPQICDRCGKEIESDSVYCRFCGKKIGLTPQPNRKRTRREKGSGGITRLSGNRAKPWRALKYVHKKGILIGCYATRAEAVKALEEANRRDISAMFDWTLQETFERFCEIKKDCLSESGYTNYKSGFRYLLPYSNMKMRDIRTEHFQKAIDNARAEGSGSATWNKIRNIGSLLCQYAMSNDVLDKNYAQLVIMPKDEAKRERAGFTKEQLETLWNNQENDGVKTVLILCYTGFRINEFLDIKKEDVDLTSGIIRSSGSKTEAGKNRIVPILSPIRPFIEYFMQLPGEYLISNRNGGRAEKTNYTKRVFHPALEFCGIGKENNLSPHSCRHTFAWLCVTSNVDQKAAMDMLGHSKFEITASIYANMTKNDIGFLKSQALKIQ